MKLQKSLDCIAILQIFGMDRGLICKKMMKNHSTILLFYGFEKARMDRAGPKLCLIPDITHIYICITQMGM